MSFRIGQGYDAHQLKTGLPLIIGGVDIPHTKGVLAHSDGDVLIHAIIDAMLGAVSFRDIGQLFPNSKEWKNASGLEMLKYTYNVIKHKFPDLQICDQIDFNKFNHALDIRGKDISDNLSYTNIAIGPEGGWSEDELDKFSYTSSINEFTFRTETAAIVAVSLML